MYARLVVGMQSQIQRDYQANGGVVHPLSKKSLQGVVKTKQANDEELERLDEDGSAHHADGGDDDGGWEMTYIEEGADEGNSVGSPYGQAQKSGQPSKSGSDGSLSTHGSVAARRGEEEDDCVFSLDL